MIKILAVLSFKITFLFFLFSCRGEDNSEIQQKQISGIHTDTLAKKTILAAELSNAFFSNKELATKQYLDKTIIIVGQAWDLTQDKASGLFFYKENEPKVICSWQNRSISDQISIGDIVTLRGVCKGLNGSNVKIVDCSLVKVER